MNKEELKEIIRVAKMLMDVQQQMADTGKKAVDVYQETEHPSMLETIELMMEVLPPVKELVDKFEDFAGKIMEEVQKVQNSEKQSSFIQGSDTVQ